MSDWVKPSLFDSTKPLFRWLVLFNVILTTFLALLSAAVTIVANESIQGELALSDPEATWVTTFYLLGVNSTVPAATWFADRYGYKKMYAIGVLIFAIGSGCAGFAWDFISIGAMRLAEGIGAGLIFPVGLAMINRNFSKEQVGIALILYIAIAFGGGLGVGMPLSGYLSEFHSWRDVFFLILPLGLIAAIDCWLIHEETPSKKNGDFDYWGFFFFVSFIASLLVALSFGALPSTNSGWESPLIVGCFLTAFISLGMTILIESRVAKPIIPLQLFHNPIFSVSCLSMFLLGMALFSSISSTSSFLLNALKYDRYITGLIGMTYGVSMAGASIIASALMRKIPIPLLTIGGLSVLIVSYFLNNEITLQSYPGQVCFILFLRGMGVGLSLGPITSFGLSSVAKELSGEAATLLTFFRQVGGTYGGTVIGIIVIKRQIFHTAYFSESVHPQNPGYRYTWQRLYDKAYSVISDNQMIASMRAKGSIIQTIKTQAFIQAINDAMFVFGCVTLIVVFVILYLYLKQQTVKKIDGKENLDHPS